MRNCKKWIFSNWSTNGLLSTPLAFLKVAFGIEKDIGFTLICTLGNICFQSTLFLLPIPSPQIWLISQPHTWCPRPSQWYPGIYNYIELPCLWDYQLRWSWKAAHLKALWNRQVRYLSTQNYSESTNWEVIEFKAGSLAVDVIARSTLSSVTRDEMLGRLSIGHAIGHLKQNYSTPLTFKLFCCKGNDKKRVFREMPTKSVRTHDLRRLDRRYTDTNFMMSNIGWHDFDILRGVCSKIPWEWPIIDCRALYTFEKFALMIHVLTFDGSSMQATISQVLPSISPDFCK